MKEKWIVFISVFVISAWSFSCSESQNRPDPEVFQLLRVSSTSGLLSTTQTVDDISVKPQFTIEFTSSVDSQSVKNSISLKKENTTTNVDLEFIFFDSGKTVQIKTADSLDYKSLYSLHIGENLKGFEGQAFPGISYSFLTENGTLSLLAANLNGVNLLSTSTITEIDYSSQVFEFQFSEAIQTDINSKFVLQPNANFSAVLSADKKKITLTVNDDLDYYTKYSIIISSGLKSANDFEFKGFSKAFNTGLNSSIKFPLISDEELLTLVQKQTFTYFWDYAHPVSGLARERKGSGETVTIGGSGFGIMGIIVGVHRNFITRSEAITRLAKITNFLKNADRFHGVWPHWINGSTGKTIAFSTNDNGADLVESAFMAQGLITAREFLDPNVVEENDVIIVINEILDSIEWDWFTRDGQDVLYWHWSPDKNWAMNMRISGYNEALIVYVLAASSKNHSIAKSVYTNGWARNGSIKNNKEFYGHTLPVGYDYGGPLFFAHYSFLGLDPRNLSDEFANYWEQNRSHSLINYEHSVRNPYSKIGYSENSWGLTASDEPSGYGVHEPTRDNGTISPTAALSSFPYTPEESMKALKHFYYVLGDKLWGEYGFYDAFNPTLGWWANSFLAIDQGPILVMIENHRSGLLWDLFMQAPEVQSGLQKLDFSTGN